MHWTKISHAHINIARILKEIKATNLLVEKRSTFKGQLPKLYLSVKIKLPLAEIICIY